MTGGGGCQGGEIVVRGEGRGGEEGQGISWGGGRRGRCSVVSSEVRFLSMWAAVLQQRRSWPRLCQGAAIIQRVSQNVAWLPVGRTRVPFDVLPHLRNLTTFFFHACLLFLFIFFVCWAFVVVVCFRRGAGRERRFMDTWLGKLRAGLAAEYGFYYRLPEAKQWQCIGQDLDLSWKDVVRPIMQYFTERTPGTYIENKESR